METRNVSVFVSYDIYASWCKICQIPLESILEYFCRKKSS